MMDGPDSRLASAVMTAYDREEAAFENAVSAANPYLSDLAATMVDPLLQKVRGNLIANKNAGIIGEGTIRHDAHVATVTGDAAVVIDCEWDASKLVYKKDGTPVPPIVPPENVGVRATLIQTASGVWKVETREVDEGTCPSSWPS